MIETTPMRRLLLALLAADLASCVSLGEAVDPFRAQERTPLGPPPSEGELQHSLNLLTRVCLDGTVRNEADSEEARALTRALWFLERACDHRHPEACAFEAMNVRYPIAPLERSLPGGTTPAGLVNGSGAVTLHLVIGPEGTVSSARVLKGPEPHALAAREDFLRRTFGPGTLCGEPATFNTVVLVTYRGTRLPSPHPPRTRFRED